MARVDGAVAPEPGPASQAAETESVGYTTLSHPEMLEAAGWKGALLRHWGWRKRRNALQQRYGEEFPFATDEPSDARAWQDLI